MSHERMAMSDLFIRFCLQNNGRLSAKKRESHFAFLTGEERALISMQPLYVVIQAFRGIFRIAGHVDAEPPIGLLVACIENRCGMGLAALQPGEDG